MSIISLTLVVREEKIIKKTAKEYDLSKLKAGDLYNAYIKYLKKNKDSEFMELHLEKNYALKDEMES